MFEDASPERLLNLQGGARAADILTCWGSRQVNLRRVSPMALRIAGGSLTLIEQTRLLEARDALFTGKGLPPPEKGPTESDPIRRIVVAAKLDPKSTGPTPSFTGISACYSLWITTRDTRRPWNYLTVLDESRKDHPRTAAVVW